MAGSNVKSLKDRRDDKELQALQEAAAHEILNLHRELNREPTETELLQYANDHPNSACYQLFTWDDEAAAHSYRIDQAEHLISLVTMGGLPQEPPPSSS